MDGGFDFLNRAHDPTLIQSRRQRNAVLARGFEPGAFVKREPGQTIKWFVFVVSWISVAGDLGEKKTGSGWVSASQAKGILGGQAGRKSGKTETGFNAEAQRRGDAKKRAGKIRCDRQGGKGSQRDGAAHHPNLWKVAPRRGSGDRHTAG